jgi:hypothetical protein
MIILLFLLIFSLHMHSAGFAGKTLLLTDQGQIAFEQLNAKMLIQLGKNDNQSIVFFHKQYVEQVVQLSCADEIITCHPKQLFWCVNKNGWVCAQDLITGDLLQTVDEKQIAIDTVQLIQQHTKIYSLTVGPPHYLYVGKYAVLAHNVVPFVLVATAPLTSTIAVKVATTALGTGLVTFGAWIANWFAKNRNNKKPKLTVAEKSVENGSVFFNPNDDDKNNKDKNKKLIYKGVDYHCQKQSGYKSPGPRNGQQALDNSYAVDGFDKIRVAIEDNLFVIFRKTLVNEQHGYNEYHGYVVNWTQLESRWKECYSIIKTLLDNKLITLSGKIIK